MITVRTFYAERMQAKNTQDPQILDGLSKCMDNETRLSVCFNQSASKSTLERLKSDSDYAISIAATRGIMIKDILRKK